MFDFFLWRSRRQVFKRLVDRSRITFNYWHGFSICSCIHGRTAVTLANTESLSQCLLPHDTTPTKVARPPLSYVNGPEFKINHLEQNSILHLIYKIDGLYRIKQNTVYVPPLSAAHAPTLFSPVFPAHNICSVKNFEK